MNKSKSEILRKRPCQRRSLLSFESIILATEQLLCELDLSNITTNKIAQRAGVSIGTLYQYFPTKEAIYLECYEKYKRTLSDTIYQKFSVQMSSNKETKNGHKEIVKYLFDCLYSIHTEKREFHHQLSMAAEELLGKNKNREIKELILSLVEKKLQESKGRELTVEEKFNCHALTHSMGSLIHFLTQPESEFYNSTVYQETLIRHGVSFLC